MKVNPLFKDQFIDQFETWLATWSANNYENACMTGNHQKLHTPPVEDAYFLAEKSWEHLLEIKS